MEMGVPGAAHAPTHVQPRHTVRDVSAAELKAGAHQHVSMTATRIVSDGAAAPFAVSTLPVPVKPIAD